MCVFAVSFIAYVRQPHYPCSTTDLTNFRCLILYHNFINYSCCHPPCDCFAHVEIPKSFQPCISLLVYICGGSYPVSSVLTQCQYHSLFFKCLLRLLVLLFWTNWSCFLLCWLLAEFITTIAAFSFLSGTTNSFYTWLRNELLMYKRSPMQ